MVPESDLLYKWTLFDTEFDINEIMSRSVNIDESKENVRQEIHVISVEISHSEHFALLDCISM
jgi:hypothetical protein